MVPRPAHQQHRLSRAQVRGHRCAVTTASDQPIIPKGPSPTCNSSTTRSFLQPMFMSPAALQVAGAVLPKCRQCRGHVHERGHGAPKGAQPAAGEGSTVICIISHLSYQRIMQLKLSLWVLPECDVSNPPESLQEWCRANGAECLAVQPPGRAVRSAEPCITSARQLSAQLLPVIASRLQSAPYVVCVV